MLLIKQENSDLQVKVGVRVSAGDMSPDDFYIGRAGQLLAEMTAKPYYLDFTEMINPPIY